MPATVQGLMAGQAGTTLNSGDWRRRRLMQIHVGALAANYYNAYYFVADQKSIRAYDIELTNERKHIRWWN